MPKLSRPGRAVRTLMTMTCEDVGVGRTCRSILAASRAAGVDCDLFTPFFLGDRPAGLPLHTVLPPALRRLPFGFVRHFAEPVLHSHYFEALGDGDIAYLWPSVPLAVYEGLARRGVPIIAETVNTRMEAAKPVLDDAYAALGLPPAHDITEARIAEQNRGQALCTAIFAPSPAAERAFAGTAVADRIVPSCYGTWVPKALPARPPKEQGAPVVFVFVGAVCVRKGAHLLLEAWRQPPEGAVLRLVGGIEPAIRARFADVLASDTVSSIGFSHDVATELLRADVALLPSLEEGDPIATYEAAAHGLPVIASEAGSGRIGAETGAITVVDPVDIEALRSVLARFAGSEELRRDRGAAARQAALGYDWSRVGPLRFARLFEKLGWS